MLNSQLNRLQVLLNSLESLVNQISPPVGSIIPYLGGYFADGTNGTFTMIQASLNDVSSVNAVLPESWRVCDGAEFFDSDSTIFNIANRFLPNLTDERFVQGFNAAGSIGGDNSQSHTHDVSSSSVAITVPGHFHTGSTSGASSNHTHTVSDLHFTGQQNATDDDQGKAADDVLTASVQTTSGFSSDHSHSFTTNGGSVDGGNDINTTGSFSSTSTDASNLENRPKFLATFFIMRIK